LEAKLFLLISGTTTKQRSDTASPTIAARKLCPLSEELGDAHAISRAQHSRLEIDPLNSISRASVSAKGGDL
jgi:hypothetical protein